MNVDDIAVDALEGFSESRRVHLCAESVELEKVHDQWSPLVWVDVVAVAWRQDRFVDMGVYDTDFDRDRVFVGRSDVGDANDLALELDGAFCDPRGRDHLRFGLGESSLSELVLDVTEVHCRFVIGNRIAPCRKCQPIDFSDEVNGWNIQDALALAAEVRNGVGTATHSNYTCLAKPPRGRNRREIAGTIGIACADEDDRRSQIYD